MHRASCCLLHPHKQLCFGAFGWYLRPHCRVRLCRRLQRDSCSRKLHRHRRPGGQGQEEEEGEGEEEEEEEEEMCSVSVCKE